MGVLGDPRGTTDCVGALGASPGRQARASCLVEVRRGDGDVVARSVKQSPTGNEEEQEGVKGGEEEEKERK